MRYPSLPMPKVRPKPMPKRPSVGPTAPVKSRVGWVGTIIAGVALVGLGLFAGRLMPQRVLASATERTTDLARPTAPTAERRLTRFDLLAMTPDELAKVDVAEMNLACAEGLPGFEGVDPKAMLAKLDEWAAKVKKNTERHLYRVKDPKYAEHYHNSENYLRAEFLIEVLQEDCGVRYNPDRIDTPNFGDSRDMFIHGMFDPKYGGTCASMPVLYAAVGRRLGYPMKLVGAREHLFCRWDTPTERFNIDGASNGGWSAHPDEHCRTWPKPITQAQIDSGEYLKSMTPAEELSGFLFSRGINEATNSKLIEARADMAEAHRLSPQSSSILGGLATTFRVLQPRVPQNLHANDPVNPLEPRPGIPIPGRRP